MLACRAAVWGSILKTKAHSAYRSRLRTEEVILRALAHLKGHMRGGTKTSSSPEGWMKVVLVISSGERPDCGLELHALAHCANRSDPPVEEKISRASARTKEHYVWGKTRSKSKMKIVCMKIELHACKTADRHLCFEAQNFRAPRGASPIERRM